MSNRSTVQRIEAEQAHERTTFPRRLLLSTVAAVALLNTLPLTLAQAQSDAASSSKPRIGIIGAGTVGATLGGLFVAAGYPIILSSRHPEELRALSTKLGPLSSVATPKEAAASSQIILMAVPFGALAQLGASLRQELRGKIVIDATNPYPWRDGDVAVLAEKEGVGLVSASLLPNARLVRAFNTMSTLTIAKEAHRPGAPLAIPIAGDDGKALEAVTLLIRDIGLEPVKVGGLASARLFQPGALGWQAIGTASELRARFQLP